jgi:hypothetical protein|tara:strand:+ start:76 stop:270 length:195 start_codon:yes stop_codon:yes gene_type:complete
MVFDTITWLKSAVIKYEKGVPTLLQYKLEDEEMITLAQLVDALSAARVDEAIKNYKDGKDNGYT